MGIKDKALNFAKKFKLTSHHAIERFGVLFGIFMVTGAIVLAGSGAAAYKNGNDAISEQALYTPKFKTSKTSLQGDVDGIYTNEAGNRALVMMHFSDRAQISYNAADYQGFLMGSNPNLKTEPVATAGIKSSFHVFGSTGYVGVLLEADQPFEQQVLNLTMRSNSELAYDEDVQGEGDELGGDKSFNTYDQWRIFFNPGADGVKQIPAMESLNFDPAQAYYDIVLKTKEQEARSELDSKLQAMRSNLTQIESYTADMQTTKVDGLFLRPPTVPASIAGDKVTGESATEADDGVSTLALDTDYVVPGGFDINWRSGDVYEGYLDVLVPSGESYVTYLAEKQKEQTDATEATVSDMKWVLSDGSDLQTDYQTSDVTMRPLTNVMNNLSQSYSDYAKNKSDYQSGLVLALLRLDVDLRDVQANGSVNTSGDFMKVLY